MANKGVSTAESRRAIKARGAEIVERYERGESFAGIARDLGVSRGAVARAVRRLGGAVRSGSYSRPGIAERAVQVRSRYEAGEELDQIGTDLGLSFTTVLKDLKAAGGASRSQVGERRQLMSGTSNPSWKGGSHINQDGYRMIWVSDDHPFVSMRATRQRYVFEHRLVMAERLGRPLLRSETVHHINGDRTDNRAENLQLRSASHGPGVKMQCHDCGSQNVGAVAL